MKPSSLTCYPSHLIDTAPLAARYDYITGAIFAFIAAGHMGLVLRYSAKLLRGLWVHSRLTGANLLVRRKRDMLRNSAWRRRVLWGLGGREKLRRWDEFNARFMPRLETKSAASLNKYGPVDGPPAWLNTPERIAESERLKAHARKVMRANVNPNVTLDRVKMDFDGLFRLPPLPRKEKLPANIKIYTQNTISDYVWNPIPFAKVEGFGPAMVWPREFYAAMIADGEMTEDEVPTFTSVTPHHGVSQSESLWMGDQATQNRSLTLDPPCTGFALLRDDKVEEGCIPMLPLKGALKPNTYRGPLRRPCLMSPVISRQLERRPNSLAVNIPACLKYG